MKVLFLTLSSAISNIKNRGIYPDLMRYFANQGHEVYIMCPFERRTGRATELISNKNVHVLCVKTFNLTKSHFIEKGIGTLLLEYQYYNAWKKYFYNVQFDLILYSTPPITFNKVISTIKNATNSKTYLLLKDIFPQNAVDLGLMSVLNPIYHFFKYKEKQLYKISDYIGCMSNANVQYIIDHNPDLDPNKVEICPNSIELSNTLSYDRHQIREKYQIPEAATLFVYGGNLGKPQGIDFILEVLKSNLGKKDRFFIVAGGGTASKKIENFAKLHPNSNVLYLGLLQKDVFDELVHAADVGLIFLDSRYTIPNYPSRLLTYLEFKIPVLMATDKATDVGYDGEKNGYGLWVESTDVKAFNEKLSFLIAHRGKRVEMGLIGYEYLRNNFTVDVTYEIIMKHIPQPSPNTIKYE